MNCRRATVLIGGSTVLALTVCSVFTGCTGSLFRSKNAPPSIYWLSAAHSTPASQAVAEGSATAPQSHVEADLAVLRPRVRVGLESDRIAVLYPDRRLDYLADARWSGPLDEVVQDLALQAFGADARLRNVSADASAFGSGYWLEIEVEAFQAEYAVASAAPTIHVHLLARLGSSRDRRILGVFDASARVAAADNRLTAIVDAYEHATDAALAQVVAQTAQALTLVSEHR